MIQYVGLPYDTFDCWTLCQKVFAEQYDIPLPRIGDPVNLCLTVIQKPEEGCLVRVIRTAPLAEHWGVVTRNHVLHAQRPTSVIVPLHRFRENHADIEFVRVTPQ